jgi:hypothetical protein
MWRGPNLQTYVYSNLFYINKIMMFVYIVLLDLRAIFLIYETKFWSTVVSLNM